jgi:hypothetical protein
MSDTGIIPTGIIPTGIIPTGIIPTSVDRGPAFLGKPSQPRNKVPSVLIVVNDSSFFDTPDNDVMQGTKSI